MPTDTSAFRAGDHYGWGILTLDKGKGTFEARRSLDGALGFCHLRGWFKTNWEGEGYKKSIKKHVGAQFFPQGLKIWLKHLRKELVRVRCPDGFCGVLGTGEWSEWSEWSDRTGGLIPPKVGVSSATKTTLETSSQKMRKHLARQEAFETEQFLKHIFNISWLAQWCNSFFKLRVSAFHNDSVSVFAAPGDSAAFWATIVLVCLGYGHLAPLSFGNLKMRHRSIWKQWRNMLLEATWGSCHPGLCMCCCLICRHARLADEEEKSSLKDAVTVGNAMWEKLLAAMVSYVMFLFRFLTRSSEPQAEDAEACTGDVEPKSEDQVVRHT